MICILEGCGVLFLLPFLEYFSTELFICLLLFFDVSELGLWLLLLLLVSKIDIICLSFLLGEILLTLFFLVFIPKPIIVLVLLFFLLIKCSLLLILLILFKEFLNKSILFKLNLSLYFSIFSFMFKSAFNKSSFNILSLFFENFDSFFVFDSGNVKLSPIISFLELYS